MLDIATSSNRSVALQKNFKRNIKQLKSAPFKTIRRCSSGSFLNLKVNQQTQKNRSHPNNISNSFMKIVEDRTSTINGDTKKHLKVSTIFSLIATGRKMFLETQSISNIMHNLL